MKLKRILSLLLIFVILCFTACSAPSAVKPQNDKIFVYFIDVGQADCALISLNGKNMLIDGGNVEDAYQVISFIKGLGISTLDYVIASHAHEDHVGGLADIIDAFTVKNIYSPTTEYSSACFKDFVAASNRQCGITEAKGGEQWMLSQALVKILYSNAKAEETNNTSIVLRVDYFDASFLFTGDLEHDEEVIMVENGLNLSASVLKVGHHGSDTSTSYLFLRQVLPEIAVISCGKDNSYGHPHQTTLDKLTQSGATIYRTDLLGTVCVYSDGVNIFVDNGKETSTHKPTDATPGFEQGAPESSSYIGNKNSKKFHLPSCSSLPAENNQAPFSSREDAVNNGYSPCGICKP